MNGFYLLAFMLGILSFGIGLGIGWNMRGGVKEEDLLKFRSIREDIQKLGWKLDELKKVSK